MYGNNVEGMASRLFLADIQGCMLGRPMAKAWRWVSFYIKHPFLTFPEHLFISFTVIDTEISWSRSLPKFTCKISNSPSIFMVFLSYLSIFMVFLGYL